MFKFKYKGGNMFKKTVLLMSIFSVVNGIYAREPFDSINKGDSESLKKFIAEEKEKGTLKKSINQANNFGWTPLWFGVYANQLEMIRLLLENGAKASINIGNHDQITPLISAAQNNNLDIMKLLLTNGAIDSINVASQYNNTPLSWAIYRNNEKMVKLLIYCGAEITDYIKRNSKPKNETIAKLIKNPGLIHSILTKEEENEFAKLSGDKKTIEPDFGTGVKVEKSYEKDKRAIIKFN